MGQDKISQQKDKEIQPEPVDNDDGCVENLTGPIDRHCRGNKYRQQRQSRLAEKLPQTILLNHAHKHEQYRKDPQELNVPEDPDPAHHADQCFAREGNVRFSLKESPQGDIDISL